MLEQEFLLPNGDIGIVSDDDWKLLEFGEVLEMIKTMPKLDRIIKHYSQYANIQHMTACTMYCGINGIATIENKDFSEQEIQAVINL